jgi:hypothetical protein
MIYRLKCSDCGKIDMDINTRNKETYATFQYLYGKVSKVTGTRTEMKCPLKCGGVLELK